MEFRTIGSMAFLKEAWPFYRTMSGVCLCYELEKELKGVQGHHGCSYLSQPPAAMHPPRVWGKGFGGLRFRVQGRKASWLRSPGRTS